MNWLLPLLLASVLGAAPALAQAVPRDARADGWCGALLSIVVGDMPANPSAQDLELAGIFLDASTMLFDRAAEAHRRAGFSQAQTNAFVDDMGGIVQAQIDAGTMELSFEDCAERAGFQR